MYYHEIFADVSPQFEMKIISDTGYHVWINNEQDEHLKWWKITYTVAYIVYVIELSDQETLQVLTIVHSMFDMGES